MDNDDILDVISDLRLAMSKMLEICDSIEVTVDALIRVKNHLMRDVAVNNMMGSDPDNWDWGSL